MFLVKFWKRSFLEAPITTNLFSVLEFCWTPCSYTLWVLFWRLEVSWFYISLSILYSPGFLTPYILLTVLKLEGGKGPGRCMHGFNARKVISEVYTSFVLQCIVSGRWCKHKTDVEAWLGIHLSHKKINEIFWF